MTGIISLRLREGKTYCIQIAGDMVYTGRLNPYLFVYDIRQFLEQTRQLIFYETKAWVLMLLSSYIAPFCIAFIRIWHRGAP